MHLNIYLVDSLNWNFLLNILSHERMIILFPEQTVFLGNLVLGFLIISLKTYSFNNSNDKYITMKWKLFQNLLNEWQDTISLYYTLYTTFIPIWLLCDKACGQSDLVSDERVNSQLKIIFSYILLKWETIRPHQFFSTSDYMVFINYNLGIYYQQVKFRVNFFFSRK